MVLQVEIVCSSLVIRLLGRLSFFKYSWAALLSILLSKRESIFFSAISVTNLLISAWNSSLLVAMTTFPFLSKLRPASFWTFRCYIRAQSSNRKVPRVNFRLGSLLSYSIDLRYCAFPTFAQISVYPHLDTRISNYQAFSCQTLFEQNRSKLVLGAAKGYDF